MGLYKSKLLPILILLLAPTVLVGWLGFSQMRRFESEQLSSLEREAAGALRSAEQAFIGLIRALEEDTRKQLNGLDFDAIAASIQSLERESPAIHTGFVLSPGASPLFPRLATSSPWPLAAGTITLNSRQRNNAAVRSYLKKLDNADVLLKLGLPKEANDELQELPDRSGLPVTLTALGSLKRGLVLRKLGRLDEALLEFETALVFLESSGKGASESKLVLSLMLAQAETEDLLRTRVGKGKEADDARARERSVLESILLSIAEGKHDTRSDEFLEGIFSRALELAGKLYEDEKGLKQVAERAEALDLERRARRHSVRSILDRSPLGDRIKKAGESKLAALTLPASSDLERKKTALLVATRIRDARDRSLYIVLEVDLELLLAEPMLEIERRLARNGRYQVSLLDENNERLGEVLQARVKLSPEEAKLASEIAPPLRLGPPLLGFSLAAIPRDPSAILSSRRSGLITRGLLLLALALSAGAGAFLLARMVRREGELANLKTSFVGRVSHELKTPLALIRMYGETLAMGRTDDPKRIHGFASIIAQESDRLTRMIDNILDFSKIDAGKKRYQPSRVELGAQLRTCIDSYRPHLEEAGFRLELEDLPELWADVDPEALTQALLNLLGNARKYVDDAGEKSIQVGLASADGMAQIEVRDRGIGVADAEREQIFETFYRALAAGERRGAGLGLALVKHFAEAHGGEVRCLSRKGPGSIFQITLPLAQEGGPNEARGNAP